MEIARNSSLDIPIRNITINVNRAEVDEAEHRAESVVDENVSATVVTIVFVDGFKNAHIESRDQLANSLSGGTDRYNFHDT